MARQPRDARIETREARKRLKVRKEPYWRQVHQGLAIGYYRGVKSGSWHVRRTVDGRKVYQRIARADDYSDSDGGSILSYGEAVKRAMTADKAKPATPEGKYTVKEAVNDYLIDLSARSPRGYRDAELRLEHHVIPKLGKRAVAALTREQIRRWHQAIAAADSNDADSHRRRRVTANRNLAALKAVLNLAYYEGKVSERGAWDRVKPFKNVDQPRQRFLTMAEVRKLLRKLPDDLSRLAQAAVLTGGRYGELAALTSGDFDSEAGTIGFRETKAGRIRYTPLTDEGVMAFDEWTAGKARDALVFARDNGEPWKKSDQIRPVRAASADAKLDSAVTFHDLRRTYGALLARAGVSLQVIAAAMGHADQRMTERHYAHLQPDHVAREVRKKLPKLGLKAKVARLHG